jgi:hypothetical protein
MGLVSKRYPAYFTAVASVEAFLYEYYLGICAKWAFKDNPLWYIPDSDLERWELQKKLLLIPQFLFRKTFDKGAHPYQDMQVLIQVRNYLAHYKMYEKAPKSFADLEQRKITLQDQQPGATFTWPVKLSCTEGVRWAHNTVCNTIKELLSFADDFPLGKEIFNEYQVYEPIPESAIIRWYEDD